MNVKRTKDFIFVIFVILFLYTACGSGSGSGESHIRSWGTPELIETYNAGDASSPEIAFDGTGNALAIWKQSDGVNTNILYNRYEYTEGWAIAGLLESDNSGHASSSKIAFDCSGNAIAVWRQSDSARYNICSNRYMPGYGWGMTELIENMSLGDAGYPEISIDNDGNAIAVWEQQNGTRYDIWSNRYEAGIGWGTPELLENDSVNSAGSQSAAFDGSGNAIAVWAQSDGVRENVWSNRYESGTGWGTAELIESNNSNDAIFPKIASDSSGNAIAVWYQYNGTGYDIWSNRYTSGTGWGTAELIENDTVNYAEYPEIAIDESGNGLVVWHQDDGTRYNIWSNRYVAGTGWGTPELIETDNAGSAFAPKIAFDGSGNALAVWRQHDGTRYNIWSNRYTSGTGWGTAELIETDDQGNAEAPCIAFDEDGNAIAVWQQSDGTRSNIWANRYE